jgi:hypothetical protein
MFVAENFIRSLVDKYGRHIQFIQMVWYLVPTQACTFLHLKNIDYIHPEKSLIERIMQYYKDRTECFEDDYYPCTSKKKKKNCDQGHMYTIG